MSDRIAGARVREGWGLLEFGPQLEQAQPTLGRRVPNLATGPPLLEDLALVDREGEVRDVMDLTRQDAGKRGLRVVDDQDPNFVDLRAPQGVAIERRPFQERARLPAVELVGPEPDIADRPERVSDKLPRLHRREVVFKEVAGQGLERRPQRGGLNVGQL